MKDKGKSSLLIEAKVKSKEQKSKPSSSLLENSDRLFCTEKAA